MTVLFVCIAFGAPLLPKLPRFRPPIALVTTLSPVPVDVVILFPLMLYELGAAFVMTYGESIEICAEVTNFCVISAKALDGEIKSKKGTNFFNCFLP